MQINEIQQINSTPTESLITVNGDVRQIDSEQAHALLVRCVEAGRVRSLQSFGEFGCDGFEAEMVR